MFKWIKISFKCGCGNYNYELYDWLCHFYHRNFFRALKYLLFIRIEIKFNFLGEKMITHFKVHRFVIIAWLKSIWKWLKIVMFIGIDKGGKNCAFCQLFPTCESCPITFAGYYSCINTPYYYAFDKSKIFKYINRKNERKTAIKGYIYSWLELFFIISLIFRPKCWKFFI